MKLNDIILLNAAALNAGGPGSGRRPGGGVVNRGSTKTAKTRSDGVFQLKNTSKGALDKHLRSKFKQG